MCFQVVKGRPATLRNHLALALIAVPFLMRSPPIGAAFKPEAPMGWPLLLGDAASKAAEGDHRSNGS